jgi:hypothetical protein
MLVRQKILLTSENRSVMFCLNCLHFSYFMLYQEDKQTNSEKVLKGTVSRKRWRDKGVGG